MKILNTFLLTLASFLTLCCADAFAALAMDGLCIFPVAGNGFAHGFIIDQTLVTTAHGAYFFTGTVYCTQNGKLVDISSFVDQGSLNIHPSYEMLKRRTGQFDYFHDSATVSLSVRIPTDFKLAEGRTYNEMVFRLDRLNASQNWVTMRLRPDSSSDSIVITNRNHVIVRTPDSELLPGDSGSPMVSRLGLNKFMVVGMAVGVSRDPNAIHQTNLILSTPAFKRFVDSAQKKRTCQNLLVKPI